MNEIEKNLKECKRSLEVRSLNEHYITLYIIQFNKHFVNIKVYHCVVPISH